MHTGISWIFQFYTVFPFKIDIKLKNPQSTGKKYFCTVSTRKINPFGAKFFTFAQQVHHHMVVCQNTVYELTTVLVHYFYEGSLGWKQYRRILKRFFVEFFPIF